MVFAVGKGLRRCDDDALAGVYAQRIEVFHVADRYTVVVTVTHNLVFYLLPTLEALLHEHLGRERKCFLCQFVELFLVVAEAGAKSAERICGTEYHGIAQFLSCGACLLDRLASFALDSLYVDFVKSLYEQLAVLGVHDSLHLCTEHTHAILLKNARLVKFNAAVQCCLSAECEQNTVGTLFLDDPLDEIRLHGKEVYLVGHALGSLHRGDVRVDENSVNSLFPKCFEGLRA